MQTFLVEIRELQVVLILVPTPIGNLADITLRALEVLKDADWVACEDTRRTGQLLKHFDIQGKRLVSFFEHNEAKTMPRLLEALRCGERVALVSDGGTPSISDPGFRLVRAAMEEDLPITVLPGPTACIPALVASGLPVASFTFHGFPPKKPGKLRNALEAETLSPHTHIFYESPHRVGKFLTAALETWGETRQAAVCRELTKKFEEIARGTLAELAERFSAQTTRGEIVVVIEGHKEKRE